MALLPWGQMADKNFMLLAKQVPQFSAAKNYKYHMSSNGSQMNYINYRDVWIPKNEQLSCRPQDRCSVLTAWNDLEMWTGNSPANLHYHLNGALPYNVKPQLLRNRRYLVENPICSG